MQQYFRLHELTLTDEAPRPEPGGFCFTHTVLLDILLPTRYIRSMQTQIVKLPRVPIEIVAKAKSAAVMRGMTFTAYLTEVLVKAMHKDGKK